MIPKPVMLLSLESLLKNLRISDNFLKSKLDLKIRGSTIYILPSHLEPTSLFISIEIKDKELQIRKHNPIIQTSKGVVRLRSTGCSNILLINTDNEEYIKVINKEKEFTVSKDSAILLRRGDSVFLLGKLISKGKGIILTSPITGDVIAVDNYIISKGTEFNLLATIRKNKHVTLYVWDPLTGHITQYNIDYCKITDAVCGVNMCVISCEDKNYSVSISNIHEIPNGLQPLIKCDESEYYYDIENKLITKYNKGMLEPLTDIKPTRISCISDNELIIGTERGVFKLHGNLLMKLIDYPVIDIKAGQSVVLYPSKGKTWSALSTNGAITSAFNAIKCDVMNNDLIWCLVEDQSLIALNPREIISPKIEVIKDNTDSGGYAIIKLIPWFEGCKYIVSGPVRIMNTVISGDSAVLSIRPKVLGWRGDVKVIVKSPIHWINSHVRLNSSKPTLKAVRIINCNYIEGGVIKGTEDNFEVTLSLDINWPAPENPTLKIGTDNSGPLKISSKEVTLVKSELAGNTRNYSVYIRGRLKDYRHPISVNLKAVGLCGEVYELGKLVINPEKYVKKNPLVKSKLMIKHAGQETEISSSAGINIMVECKNRTYTGFRKVVVRECIEPIFIRETVNEGKFMWQRITRLRTLITPEVRRGSKFNIKLKGISKGGLEIKAPSITIADSPDVECSLKDLSIYGDNEGLRYKLKLACRVSQPSLILIANDYGLKTVSSAGLSSNLFSIILNGCVSELLSDLVVYALPVLESRIPTSVIKFEEILKKLLMIGSVNALVISKHIINPSK